MDAIGGFSGELCMGDVVSGVYTVICGVLLGGHRAALWCHVFQCPCSRVGMLTPTPQRRHPKGEVTLPNYSLIPVKVRPTWKMLTTGAYCTARAGFKRLVR